MSTVIGELDSCDQFRMPRHSGHALAGVVVVHRQGLVRAGGGGEGAGAVKRDLDQRPIVARRALLKIAI